MYRSHARPGARVSRPASRTFGGIDPTAWQPRPITVQHEHPSLAEHRDAECPVLEQDRAADDHVNRGGTDAW